MSRYSLYTVEITENGKTYQKKACGYCKKDIILMMWYRHSKGIVTKITLERAVKKTDNPNYVRKRTTLADARLALVTAFQNPLMEGKNGSI